MSKRTSVLHLFLVAPVLTSPTSDCLQVLSLIIYCIYAKEDLHHSTIPDCVGGHYEKNDGQQFHQYQQSKETSLISKY